MSMALAHALEFPGKRRLDERTYMTVQTIYYPGFTLGGPGEALAVALTLALLLFTPHASIALFWIVAAFVALSSMHIVFWFVTQPVNRYWLKHYGIQRCFAANGEDIKVVQELLRHANSKITIDVYAQGTLARKAQSRVASMMPPKRG